MKSIGTDAKGAAGKIPLYPRYNWGKAQKRQKFHFAPVTILTLLSNVKIVKTAAIKRFLQLTIPNAFVAGAMLLDPAGTASPDT